MNNSIWTYVPSFFNNALKNSFQKGKGVANAVYI